MLKAMLLAGCGGFVGTALRYLVGRLVPHITHSHFPWATLAVNLVGWFIIGLLFGAAERGNLLSANMNVVLITGFCGGFTTFSTFADDMFLMAKGNNWLPLVAYVAVSLAVGFVLVWAGRSIVTSNV